METNNMATITETIKNVIGYIIGMPLLLLGIYFLLCGVYEFLTLDLAEGVYCLIAGCIFGGIGAIIIQATPVIKAQKLEEESEKRVTAEVEKRILAEKEEAKVVSEMERMRTKKCNIY